MCKIAIIPRMPSDKAKRIKLNKLATYLVEEMIETEQDGFGYVATDLQGKLIGEKWRDVADRWRSSSPLSTLPTELSVVVEDPMSVYARIGEGGILSNTRITSLLLHARKATNAICIDNTHPFHDADLDTALIHNGVVSTIGKSLTRSTCDSEVILNEYLDAGINLIPEDVSNMTKRIDGWYAVGIYSRDGNNHRILDVIHDNQSRLSLVKLPELDSWIYVTSVQDLKVASRLSGVKIGDIYTVKPNLMIRYNLDTGEISNHKFTKQERNKWESYYTKGKSKYNYLKDDTDDTLIDVDYTPKLIGD